MVACTAVGGGEQRRQCSRGGGERCSFQCCECACGLRMACAARRCFEVVSRAPARAGALALLTNALLHHVPCGAMPPRDAWQYQSMCFFAARTVEALPVRRSCSCRRRSSMASIQSRVADSDRAHCSSTLCSCTRATSVAVLCTRHRGQPADHALQAAGSQRTTATPVTITLVPPADTTSLARSGSLVSTR